MRSHRISINLPKSAGAVQCGGRRVERFGPAATAGFCGDVTNPRRRGGIMIVAMVCMVLATMILGAMLKLARVHSRQMRTEQQNVQADWLVISGVERAASRLFDDRNYTGELWEIEPHLLGSDYAGQAKIRVTPSTEIADEFAITVVVTYPLRSPHSIRRTKTVSVELNSQL